MSSVFGQESRAVEGHYRAMQGTCTESFHLILRQRSEYWIETTLKLSANMESCKKRLYKCIFLQYFQSSSPTELESVSHVSSFAMKIFTNYSLPSYSFLTADTLRELVALTFDLFNFVSSHTWRVTYSTSPPSLKILWLSVLELWVLIFPIGYNWQCVCKPCACRITWPMRRGKFFPHIWYRWPRSAYSLSNLYGYTSYLQNSVALC